MKNKTRRGLSLSRAQRGGLNRVLALVWLALALAGCEQAEESALRDWMAEQRRPFDAGAALAPEPVPAPAPTPAGRIAGGDPFDARRLSGPPQQRMAASPDQPLAARPLSSLRMVGSLRRGDEVVALLQADQQVYQVPVGAVLGTDRARVLRISEDGITLRVALPGAQGEPLARTFTLPLHGP